MGELRDRGVEAVIGNFMSKPVGPYPEMINGREIWGRPTTFESASDYVGSLTVDERFALLREAVDEGQALSDDDMFMMGNSDIKDFPTLVERACSDLLRIGAELVPEVLARDDEQSKAFDAVFDPEPED